MYIYVILCNVKYTIYYLQPLLLQLQFNIESLWWGKSFTLNQYSKYFSQNIYSINTITYYVFVIEYSSRLRYTVGICMYVISDISLSLFVRTKIDKKQHVHMWQGNGWLMWSSLYQVPIILIKIDNFKS